MILSARLLAVVIECCLGCPTAKDYFSAHLETLYGMEQSYFSTSTKAVALSSVLYSQI